MPKTTSQRLMFRYLYLHGRATPKSKQPPDEAFPPLEKLFEDVWASHPTVGSRHMPALRDGEVEKDQRYVVGMRMRKLQGTGAALIRFCVFTGGEVPAFAPSDLDSTEAEIRFSEVKDGNERTLAPAVEFSALALGRVLLVQSKRGASSASALQAFIHYFGKKLSSKSFVRPEFLMVAPADIERTIREAGGVVSISFGLVRVDDSGGEAKPLDRVHDIEDRICASRVRVHMSATGEELLDEAESLAILQEEDKVGIEHVTLHLKNKETLTGDQMRLCKAVDVPLKNGLPDCSHVDLELIQYLNDLMKTDAKGFQSVKPDGTLGQLLRLTRRARE